jgi:hypothetical protein
MIETEHQEYIRQIREHADACAAFTPKGEKMNEIARKWYDAANELEAYNE